MKLLIIAAAAVTLAGPVVAQSAMTSTSLEVRQHFAADEGGNEDTIYLNGTGITSSSAEIHAQNDANANMDNSTLDVTQNQLLTSGSDTVANMTAANIFLKLAQEEGAGAVN